MRSLFLSFLLFQLFACGKQTTMVADNMKPDASFDNTRWKLIKLADFGTLPRLEKDVFVRFNKEKSQLNGHAWCNIINGSYSLSANALKIGPVASTKMMCGPTQMQIESEFTKALTAIDNVLIIGDRLQLKKGITVLAELEALYL